MSTLKGLVEDYYLRKQENVKTAGFLSGKKAVTGLSRSLGEGSKKLLWKKKNDPKTLMYGAIAALGALGIAERGYAWAKPKITRKKHLASALAFDPEAKRIYKKDPKRTEATFNTLNTFNPDAAADPLVASSWIRQTMEQPILPIKTVEEAGKAIRQYPRKPEGLMGKALKASALPKIVEGVLEEPDILVEPQYLSPK